MIPLPRDFNEFLRLLNSSRAKYLLIGGYAVNFHGYSRSTGDLHIWIARDPENAARVAAVLREFGFSGAQPTCSQRPILRMGVPPLRLEILTSISGVDFEECYGRRILAEIGGCEVSVIGLEDLKRNKRASGRAKDLADLDELA